MPTQQNLLGATIKRFRERKGMTQYAVAQRMRWRGRRYSCDDPRRTHVLPQQQHAADLRRPVSPRVLRNVPQTQTAVRGNPRYHRLPRTA